VNSALSAREVCDELLTVYRTPNTATRDDREEEKRHKLHKHAVPSEVSKNTQIKKIRGPHCSRPTRAQCSSIPHGYGSQKVDCEATEISTIDFGQGPFPLTACRSSTCPRNARNMDHATHKNDRLHPPSSRGARAPHHADVRSIGQIHRYHQMSAHAGG
jgi:hypothetical protein